MNIGGGGYEGTRTNFAEVLAAFLMKPQTHSLRLQTEEMRVQQGEKFFFFLLST